MTKYSDKIDRILEKTVAENTDKYALQLLNLLYDRSDATGVISDLIGSAAPVSKRVGVWIASELGQSACAICHLIAPFIESDKYFTVNDASDVLIICECKRAAKYIGKCVNYIDSEDHKLVYIAVNFVVRANINSLVLALPFCKEPVRVLIEACIDGSNDTSPRNLLDLSDNSVLGQVMSLAYYVRRGVIDTEVEQRFLTSSSEFVVGLFAKFRPVMSKLNSISKRNGRGRRE
jgi:hypothetical protein